MEVMRIPRVLCICIVFVLSICMSLLDCRLPLISIFIVLLRKKNTGGILNKNTMHVIVTHVTVIV